MTNYSSEYLYYRVKIEIIIYNEHEIEVLNKQLIILIERLVKFLLKN